MTSSYTRCIILTNVSSYRTDRCIGLALLLTVYGRTSLSHVRESSAIGSSALETPLVTFRSIHHLTCPLTSLTSSFITGAFGGEELLLHYLLEHMDGIFFTKAGRSLSPAEKARLRHILTEFSRKTGPGTPASDSLSPYTFNVPTDTGGVARLHMPRAGYTHFWECAYREPLKVAAQQFSFLSKVVRNCKVEEGRIMIAGGGVEHGRWRYSLPLPERLEQLREQAGLKRHIYDNDITDIEQWSAMRGTIAVVEYALSAKQFLAQGIGIGLQRKLPNASEWEENAPLVVYYVSHPEGIWLL